MGDPVRISISREDALELSFGVQWLIGHHAAAADGRELPATVQRSLDNLDYWIANCQHEHSAYNPASYEVS